MRVAHSHKLFLHRAVGITGVLLVVLAGACKGKEKGSADSTHPADSPVADTVPRAPDSAQQAILDKGISGLPGEGAATLAYLQGNTYPGTPEASEIIDEDVDCAVGNTHHYSHLRIKPVNYAHQIPWGQVPGSGKSHLYARIEVSKANCPNVGLLINEQGYLTLSGDASTGPVVEVYKKTLNGVVATGIKAKKIVYCDEPPGDKPGTHLWTPVHCKLDKPPHTPAYRGTALRNPPLVLASLLPTAYFMAVFLDSGIWVSCSTGCCEVQF